MLLFYNFTFQRDRSSSSVTVFHYKGIMEKALIFFALLNFAVCDFQSKMCFLSYIIILLLLQIFWKILSNFEGILPTPTWAICMWHSRVEWWCMCGCLKTQSSMHLLIWLKLKLGPVILILCIKAASNKCLCTPWSKCAKELHTAFCGWSCQNLFTSWIFKFRWIPNYAVLEVFGHSHLQQIMNTNR